MNRRGFLRFIGLASVAAPPIAIAAGSSPEFAEAHCVRGGFLTPNELRVIEDLPPIRVTDLKFIAHRKFALHEICQFYRVPPGALEKSESAS
jgi:hypothetical protein